MNIEKVNECRQWKGEADARSKCARICSAVYRFTCCNNFRLSVFILHIGFCIKWRKICPITSIFATPSTYFKVHNYTSMCSYIIV